MHTSANPGAFGQGPCSPTIGNHSASSPIVTNYFGNVASSGAGSGNFTNQTQPRSPSAQRMRRPATATSTSNSSNAGYAVGRGAFANKTRVGQISAPYNLRRTETEADDARSEKTTAPTATGSSVQSLETIRRHIVKFLAEDGSSRSVDVSRCTQATDVLAKVLHKFGLPNDAESTQYMRHWVVAMTDANAQLKVLSEIELMAVCSQPHIYDPVWQHGLYLLRTSDESPLRPGSLREAPVDPFRLTDVPSTRRASTFSILSGLGGTAVQPVEEATSPTRSSAYARVKAATPDLVGPLPAVRRRVRNFFGQRPPSELISSHLADYFPSTDSRELRRYAEQPEKQSLDVRKPSPPPRRRPPTTLYPMNKLPDSCQDDCGGMMTVDEITLGLDERESLPGYSQPSMSRVLEEPSTQPPSQPLPKQRRPSPSLKSPSLPPSSSQGLPPSTSSQQSSPLPTPTFDHAPTSQPLAPQPMTPIERKEPSLDAQSHSRMRWHKGALIGAGSFGNVFLGMNARTGILMAVKQVELPQSDDERTRRRRMMVESLESEIELLKSLHHPNIVQYLDSSSDGQYLNIFLEYVPGGSVVSLLRNYGAFEEPLVQNFVRQILLGLQFLHDGGIVHRDIKGANILVDNKGGVKISDFGISKKVEGGLLGAGSGKLGLQGSVFWMAPEVVKQNTYTDKGDIWSLGCCVVEMFTGVHPWPRLDQMQALFQIGQNKSPPPPEDISPVASDFLHCTFELDHMVRSSATTLLQHRFLTQPSDDIESEVSD